MMSNNIFLLHTWILQVKENAEAPIQAVHVDGNRLKGGR